jgi:hypothetical protein
VTTTLSIVRPPDSVPKFSLSISATRPSANALASQASAYEGDDEAGAIAAAGEPLAADDEAEEADEAASVAA